MLIWRSLFPSPSKERLFISPEVANASKWFFLFPPLSLPPLPPSLSLFLTPFSFFSFSWVLVGFILFSCFVLDFQHTFAPMDKNFNLDYFAFVSFIFACFGSMWIVEAKVPEVFFFFFFFFFLFLKLFPCCVVLLCWVDLI